MSEEKRKKIEIEVEEPVEIEGVEQQEEVEEQSFIERNKITIFSVLGILLFFIAVKFTLCNKPRNLDGYVNEFTIDSTIIQKDSNKTTYNRISTKQTTKIKPSSVKIEKFKYLISNGDIVQRNVTASLYGNDSVSVNVGVMSISLINPQIIKYTINGHDSIAVISSDGFMLTNSIKTVKKERKVITYIVRKGDTVGRIVRKFNMTVRQLDQLNPMYNLDARNPTIVVGQKLKVYAR